MKKILLTLAGYAFYALGISAQSFIGTWKTDEITNGETKGFCSFVFEPQSKITEVYDLYTDVGDGIKATIRCEVPGLYLIESGKAMTVILDRNKAAVTGHEFDYGNFFATNGITGAKIDEFKKTVENLWNTRIKPQFEPMVVKIMPFSHIGQLLYCDGETFLIASPQSDLWNDRYEFHCVNTDAQSELHRVDWVTTIVEKNVGATKKNDLPASPEPKPAEDKIFDDVEQAPTFKEGDVQAWLAKNMKYPRIAAENGIQGRVLVGFVVELDGSISQVQVLRGVDPSLDKEAVRLVKLMPKWNPGIQTGSPVRAKHSVPVRFKL